jgi:hypothetical protein
MSHKKNNFLMIIYPFYVFFSDYAKIKKSEIDYLPRLLSQQNLTTNNFTNKNVHYYNIN